MLMVIFVRPTETLARGRACAHGGHGTWLAVSPHTGTLGTCDETVLLRRRCAPRPEKFGPEPYRHFNMHSSTSDLPKGLTVVETSVMAHARDASPSNRL
jgi:hypothetical protein